MNKYVVLCMYFCNQSNKRIIYNLTSCGEKQCFSLLILENAGIFL